jgi:hypothetical protein
LIQPELVIPHLIEQSLSHLLFRPGMRCLPNPFGKAARFRVAVVADEQVAKIHKVGDLPRIQFGRPGGGDRLALCFRAVCVQQGKPIVSRRILRILAERLF